MARRRQAISSDQKAELLCELKKPESKVSELAKKYGISRSTLHKWFQGYVTEKEEIASGASPVGKFIELSVEGAKRRALEKASITFGDFSLTVEGKLEASVLCSIIKMLEG